MFLPLKRTYFDLMHVLLRSGFFYISYPILYLLIHFVRLTLYGTLLFTEETGTADPMRNLSKDRKLTPS